MRTINKKLNDVLSISVVYFYSNAYISKSMVVFLLVLFLLIVKIFVLCKYFSTTQHYSICLLNYYINTNCILCGRIKGFNSSITTILFEVGSYRTMVGWLWNARV